MGNIIKRNFYAVNTVNAARNLLGMILCRRIKNNIFKGKIVETEAYTQEEESCHAYRGVTKRNAAMFKKPGISYVYFTYGMYHCLNVITEKEGYGSAVLIRAVEPLSKNFSNTNGPGKLCRELNITKELNETDLCTRKSPLWLEYGNCINDDDVVQTTRIGIKNAVELPWRFYIKNNKFVSKK
ncbi:MAG: DNA-3-methyladenine glycosylase [Candidatus Gastranaerophilales bacterium]|nr:DNA-3-methyladenine glycosylase [Candidatus Gastranaerophilales bacterium]